MTTGSTHSAPSLQLPLGMVAVNVVGSLLLAAGALGLLVPGVSQAAPALADPTTAWTLIGVGAVLDLWSCLEIVQGLRRRQ